MLPPAAATENDNAGLLDRLKAIECPDATYPARRPALIMDRAFGSRVRCVEGREYIDLCAGFGVLALGHNPLAHQQVFAERAGASPALMPKITHAMGDVYASRAKVELLEYLLKLMPASLTHAALALTGSQAVELALKTALLATRKSGFISFAGGYHGLDLGTLPVTAKAAFREPFAGFCVGGKVKTLPFMCGAAELEAAAQEMVAMSSGLAAVIVEPVQGRSGIRPATTAWLQSLRELCDRHGALLIYDEVFTGLGRSGNMTFATRVPCDLLCLGKALGGGMPLSACVGTTPAMQAWPASTGEALHTGTFFGHPLSCEIGLATLRTIHEDDLVARANVTGARMLAWLQESVGTLPQVKAIRGHGLMLAIEFRQDGAGAELMDRLRQRGVIALASGERGECLSLTPALTITWQDWLVAAEQLLAAVKG